MIRSKLYWVVQSLGWLVFGTLLALFAYFVDKDGLTTHTLIRLLEVTILNFIVSHTLGIVYVKFGWLNLRFSQAVFRVILSAIIATLVFNTLNWALKYFHNFSPNEDYTFTDFFVSAWLFSVLYFLWSAVYFTYHLFQKNRTQELTNLKLESSQNEIELKNLREQLNPHFLFNSLNSIRALIDIEPKTAKTSVTTLSNLLRNSLMMGKKTRVSLEEELNLCKGYLDLEKIRFEERLDISCKIEAPQNLEVPPFIIQTQVENAIKHGISKLELGGKVEININFNNNILKIEVVNSGVLIESEANGIGIENTKKRLQIQYKDKANFSIFNKNNRVYATINIDYN